MAPHYFLKSFEISMCSWKVARDKTEELSEVIARLRAYERGHYGLEEAVDEANTAKKHNKIKDRQIEELTQDANNLQVKKDRWFFWSIVFASKLFI